MATKNLAVSPWKTAVALILLAGVFAAASWRLLAPRVAPEVCQLSAGPCTLGETDQLLEVEVDPLRPDAGEEFVVILRFDSDTTPDRGGDEVTVRFSMVGMDIGSNEVRWIEAAGHGDEALGTLRGSIALPACPMGRNRWRVEIKVGDRLVGKADLDVGS